MALTGPKLTNESTASNLRSLTTRTLVRTSSIAAKYPISAKEPALSGNMSMQSEILATSFSNLARLTNIGGPSNKVSLKAFSASKTVKSGNCVLAQLINSLRMEAAPLTGPPHTKRTCGGHRRNIGLFLKTSAISSTSFRPEGLANCSAMMKGCASYSERGGFSIRPYLVQASVASGTD
jgi:hypothetical protein